jgi:hypothetical protein
MSVELTQLIALQVPESDGAVTACRANVLPIRAKTHTVDYRSITLKNNLLS